MGKKIDMNQMICGQLKVMKEAGRCKDGNVLWTCQCSCGNMTTVRGKYLRSGHTKTCGFCRSTITYQSTGTRTIGKLPTGEEFIIDTEDLDIIKDHRWLPNGLGYFVAQIDGKTIRLHRLLMNAPKEKVVDHISKNKADNRKRNLRLCTHQQNIFNHKLNRNNTSGFSGVTYNKPNDRYIARITFHYQPIHLGCFDHPIEAAQAYNEAAMVLFGEYASLNKVPVAPYKLKNQISKKLSRHSVMAFSIKEKTHEYPETFYTRFKSCKI